MKSENKVTTDINNYSPGDKWSTATGNGINASHTAGFMGTLYGEKANGSRPSIKGNGCNAGMFAPFNKATIENIIFTDNNVKGTANSGTTLLNYNTYNTQFINCDFVIKALGGSYSEATPSTDWNIGWLVCGVASGNTFTNCNFINETDSDVNLYRLMSGNGGGNNTFTNCNLVNMTATYIFYMTTSVNGLASVDHLHDYTYVGTATGHIGTCAQCNQKTAEEAHYGGVATCMDAGTCKVCGYEYIPTNGNGEHSFDGSKYESDGVNHYLACKDCGTIDTNSGEAHSGGTATCAKGAICTICNLEYGEFSATHTGTFAWEIGEHADEKICSVCHAVEEMVKTDYTATIKEINYSAGDKLDVSYYFATGATASNIAFNGVALSGTLSAIDFSAVTDLKKHGEHLLTMTVTQNGQAHSVKFTVRLVTNTIADTATLNSILDFTITGTSGDSNVRYGFYKVTTDINNYSPGDKWSTATGNGINASHTAGFMGTLYGEKANGSRPSIKGNGCNAGMFAPFNRGLKSTIAIKERKEICR